MKNIPTLILLLSLCSCLRTEAPPTSPEAPHTEEHAHAPAEIHLTPEAIQTNGIKLAQAQKQALVRTLSVPARVTLNSERMAHVGSPLRGRISAWKVRVGDLVKKGDALVIIDSPELGEAQTDYLQKLSAAKTLEASAELAKNIWRRNKKVFEETKGIALSQVEQRESEYQAIDSALQSAQSAALAAKRKLGLLGMRDVAALEQSGEISSAHTLYAPMEGAVINREATEGEWVSPDKEALLVLADLQTLWVLADIPENQAVAQGAQVWINGKTQGAVAFVSPTVDEATRTYKARIELKNSAFKVGAFVQVNIATDEKREPTLVIPESAIQTLEGKSVVFVPVKGKENTFVLREIVTGEAVGEWVPVLSGLSEGESLVIEGAFVLKAEILKSSVEKE